MPQIIIKKGAINHDDIAALKKMLTWLFSHIDQGNIEALINSAIKTALDAHVKAYHRRKKESLKARTHNQF